MERILGCLAPLSTGDCVGTSPRRSLGAHIASKEFEKNVLKYGTFDSYHFLHGVEQGKSKEEIANYLNSQKVDPRKVVAYKLGLKSDLFKTTKYYVLHGFSFNLVPMVAVRRSLGKLVAPITGMTHAISYGHLMDIWVHSLLGDILPCDAIVCTSTGAREVFQRTFELVSDRLSQRLGCKPPNFRGHLEVIPLGIDTEYWSKKTDKADVRRLLGLPEHLCIILSAARFSVYDKMDPAPLLLAVRKLLDILGDDSFKLILVGDDTRSKDSLRVRQLVHRLGLTRVVQVETNVAPLAMRQYFGAADIFISLSDNLQETFGLTVIQAMACGLPVVVSDWNGYKDTVVNNETGFRIRTYWTPCDEEISNFNFHRHWLMNQFFLAQSVAIDIGEVVKSLHVLATNPALRHRLGETGRKRAEELYSWKVVIKRYVDLWDECRERFDEMGTYDFHEGDYENLLYPSYFKRFSHYATKILVSEDRLALSDVVSEAISYKNVIKDLLSSGALQSTFRQPIFDSLNSRLSSGEITFGALLEEVRCETNYPDDLVARHIMWLIKYGILTPVGQTSLNIPSAPCGSSSG